VIVVTSVLSARSSTICGFSHIYFGDTVTPFLLALPELIPYSLYHFFLVTCIGLGVPEFFIL